MSTVKLLSGSVVLSLDCRYQYSSVIVSFSLVRSAISTHSGSARLIGRSPYTALVASRTSARSGSDKLNQSDDASCLERVVVREPSRDCTTACITYSELTTSFQISANLQGRADLYSQGLVLLAACYSGQHRLTYKQSYPTSDPVCTGMGDGEHLGNISYVTRNQVNSALHPLKVDKSSTTSLILLGGIERMSPVWGGM